MLGACQAHEKRGGALRYAPIILIPIDIVKKSAKSGYLIRMRDDESQVNASLVEILRSGQGIAIDGLDPLSHDEAGVDARLVFDCASFIRRRTVMANAREAEVHEHSDIRNEEEL